MRVDEAGEVRFVISYANSAILAQNSTQSAYISPMVYFAESAEDYERLAREHMDTPTICCSTTAARRN